MSVQLLYTGEQLLPSPACFRNPLVPSATSSRNIPVAQPAFCHGDSGQIGPTSSSSFVIRSMTCPQRLSWGTCYAPAWSCDIQLWARPELDTVAWRVKPCRDSVLSPIISFSLLSPPSGQALAAPTQFPEQPNATGYGTTICQNLFLSWFPSSFLTLYF